MEQFLVQNSCTNFEAEVETVVPNTGLVIMQYCKYKHRFWVKHVIRNRGPDNFCQHQKQAVFVEITTMQIKKLIIRGEHARSFCGNCSPKTS